MLKHIHMSYNSSSQDLHEHVSKGVYTVFQGGCYVNLQQERRPALLRLSVRYNNCEVRRLCREFCRKTTKSQRLSAVYMLPGTCVGTCVCRALLWMAARPHLQIKKP